MLEKWMVKKVLCLGEFFLFVSGLSDDPASPSMRLEVILITNLCCFSDFTAIISLQSMLR